MFAAWNVSEEYPRFVCPVGSRINSRNGQSVQLGDLDKGDPQDWKEMRLKTR
jgi:hypothetical protein